MDPKEIDGIAELMERRSLTRVRMELPDGSAVELERGGAAPAAMPMPVAMPAAMPAMPAVAAAPAAPAAPADAAPAADAEGESPLDMSKVTAVKAPMVGVFYAAPSPGAEPFVKVGSKVKKGDTLCVIEAMKLMNEVTAEVDGEVVDICAKDGELVEYGCCLMKIY